jgi:hypothetical protein
VLERRMVDRKMTMAEALDSLIHDMLWSKHGGGAKAGAAVRAQCRLLIQEATELSAASPADAAALQPALQRIIAAANRIADLT